MAFGAHSFIEQAQLGGRKKQDGISEKKAQEYEGIANDYYIYSKRGGTESQYANSHGISLSKLKRALAYMNSKKVSKNR